MDGEYIGKCGSCGKDLIAGQAHICGNHGFVVPSHHTREFVPVHLQKPEMDRVTVARLRWNGDLEITTEPEKS